MQVYGTQRPEHPYDDLVIRAGLADWKYTMFYDRVPIDARPCQRPGSYKVQLVGLDGVVYTATRFLEGHISYEGC